MFLNLRSRIRGIKKYAHKKLSIYSKARKQRIGETISLKVQWKESTHCKIIIRRTERHLQLQPNKSARHKLQNLCVNHQNRKT